MSDINLNGLLEIQKGYLADLGSDAKSKLPATATDISNIQSKLDNTYNSYKAADITTSNLLTQQDQVLDIVNTENKRLKDKKDSVDGILVAKKRAAELNNSNRLRQNGYTNILIVFIITLVVFILISIASSRFTFIPQIIFEMLIVLDICVGGYFAFVIFLDIQSRRKMNFNELDLGTMNNSGLGNNRPESTGDLLNGINFNGCVGSDCCDPDTTTWDKGNSVCVQKDLFPSLISPFTTMSFSYNVGDMQEKKVLANEPYEFSNYMHIN
jgi:hypothetical protein